MSPSSFRSTDGQIVDTAPHDGCPESVVRSGAECGRHFREKTGHPDRTGYTIRRESLLAMSVRS